MKFEVKSGQPFEVTVIVKIKDQKETFSWKKAATITVAVIVVSAVIAVVAYGALTGDFAPLRSVARAGADAIVTLMVKIAGTK